jgi:gluconate 2-dehydrogenase gamma chain
VLTGEKSLNRRKFLATAAAAGAVACTGRPETPWRTLTADEATTLEAWCECLIPEDSDPGAKRAGVVRYIDIQLTRLYKRHRKAYSKAIAALDALAYSRHSSPFAALSFDERTLLLAAFEKSENSKAFNMVLDHTLQGYFGSPRHGGNKDYASWRMVGVPPMPIRGRLQYSLEDKGSSSATRSARGGGLS